MTPALDWRIMTAMTFRETWPSLLLLSLTAGLAAQQPVPTVDAVLARVRANISEYRTSIPNLSADESVDSQRLGGGKIKEETKVQSSFRITRSSDGNLHETRIKNTVDGKPAKSQKVSLPFSYNGGFAEVIGFLQSDCFQYRLGDSEPANPGTIVLLFAMRPISIGNPKCKIDKSFRGKVLVDAQSFQVSHFEDQMEDVAVGWMANIPFVPIPSKHNIWIDTVDYAPITLGDKVFWLPKRVVSTITDKSKPLSLRYQADYSNYHRFTSTITIGPATRSESE